MALHAPHGVHQQGADVAPVGEVIDHSTGRGCAEHPAIRAGGVDGAVGPGGQRHLDVRFPLPEQGGLSADHTQHLRPLRQPPFGGACLRPEG